MKAIWEKHKKKIILSSILLVLLIGFRYVYIRLPLMTGYAEKDMCSCMFIGEREAEDVVKKEFQFSLIKYADYEVDEVNKSKTAYFTPQNGCVILNDTERNNLTNNVNLDLTIDKHFKDTDPEKPFWNVLITMS